MNDETKIEMQLNCEYTDQKACIEKLSNADSYKYKNVEIWNKLITFLNTDFSGTPFFAGRFFRIRLFLAANPQQGHFFRLTCGFIPTICSGRFLFGSDRFLGLRLSFRFSLLLQC